MENNKNKSKNTGDNDEILLKEKELLMDVVTPCLHCRGQGCLMCNYLGYKIKQVPFILMQRSYEQHE